MADLQVLGNSDVAGLFTEINNELIEAPYSSELIAPKIAWVRTGAVGAVTRFPLQMVSNAYVKRERGVPTPTRLVEVAEFQCSFSELDPDAYFLAEADLMGDIYNIIKPNLPQILNRAMLSLDQELAAWINSNAVNTYDGLTMWQTSALHPYNPKRPELGKFANKFTGRTITRANLTAALDYFTTMKGFDGNIERKPGVVHLVVSTRDQATRARKYIQEGVIASDAGGASESTTLKGEFGEVIVFPELGDANKGGSPKNWLAVRCASASDRPFVLNVPQMPQAYIDGLNPSDHTRVVYRGVRYGWRATLGASGLWPQNAAMFVES